DAGAGGQAGRPRRQGGQAPTGDVLAPGAGGEGDGGPGDALAAAGGAGGQERGEGVHAGGGGGAGGAADQPGAGARRAARAGAVLLVGDAGAGGGAVDLRVGGAQAGGAAVRGHMRYVYFTKTLRGLDVKGLAGFCKEVGLDGVDLTVRPGYPVNPDNAGKALPAAAKLLRGEGL